MPSAAVGWACLVAYAVVTTPGDVVMRDFVGYMTGNRILIGAEVEKILAILVVTAVLALAIARSRQLLVRAAVDGAAARDLARFFDPEVAERMPCDVVSPRMARIIEDLAGDWRRLGARRSDAQNSVEATFHLLGVCP
jgi:adenylate cyclase